MKALIGVDIGTQGTKAALFSESGQCLAQASRASKLHRPGGGIVEEDPERQFSSACATIRQCVDQSGIKRESIAAVGIDGQMAGIIGIGADGRNVTPYDSWLDTRCAPQIKQMNECCGDEVVCKTGYAPGFNHGPKMLWWKQEHRRTFAKVKSFVQPGGYAAMRLCGLGAKDAFIDQTYLHFSGFADNINSRWDAPLCDKLRMDGSKLPRIVEPHALIGQVTRQAARASGLATGTPVIAGCGDTAASFLACGATRAGVCVDVAGTASVFAATVPEFKPDRKHRMLGCGRSATPGLWHPYAYIGGGGMNLEWFRAQVASFGMNGHHTLNFEKLNDAAALLKLAADLPMFVPHLGGRACPSQPHLRGAWLGLSWDHSAAHLYRAILEGVALEYGCFLRVLRELYPQLPLNELRVTGGGEKSELWNKIKADALQIPVVRIARSEGAPRGVAMLAGFGVGVVRDLNRASRRWITLSRRTRPSLRASSYYGRRLQMYESHLRSLSATLSGSPISEDV